MSFLQSPPPSRFDLNFKLFGFPVTVHPLFWLIAVLFGSSSNSVTGIFLWVLAIFVSILLHEIGHAAAMRFYNQPSRIVLYGAGGLTIPEQVSWGGSIASIALSPNQQILISLAGPFTGFLFAGLILATVTITGGSIVMGSLFGILPLPFAQYPNGNEIINSLVITLLWVNIFWGLMNLLPVYPLDGGHVARYTLLKADPWGGVRTSLWISVITGSLVALAGFFLLRSTYTALLFGLLAFQSYQSLQSRI